MTNQFKTILLVFGLAILLNPTQGTDIDFKNLCLLVQAGTMIAASKSCSANYYSCTSSGPVLKQCFNGYVFDKNLQSCIPSSQAPCANPCSSAKTIPSWVSVPGTCSGFYYCNGTGGYRGDCPPGQSFEETTQQCLYSSGPCNNDKLEESQIDLCSFIPNGIYFGDAGQCSNWNLCSNNILRSGSCGTGYVYNVQKIKCDFPSNSPCTQVTYDQALTSSNGDTACNSQGAKKVGSQCNNYYVCDGKRYQLENCAANLFYDTVSQTCVNRMNARNDCNRCIGISSGFVNSYSATSCSAYYYCQDGVIKSKGACNSGYYNEIAGACIGGDQPSYGCCNPSVYSATTAVPSTQASTIQEPSSSAAPESSSAAPESSSAATEPSTAAPVAAP